MPMRARTVLLQVCLLAATAGMAQYRAIPLNQGGNNKARVYDDTLFVATDNGIFSYPIESKGSTWAAYAFEGRAVYDFVKSGSGILAVCDDNGRRVVLVTGDKGKTFSDITPSDISACMPLSYVGLTLRDMPDSPSHVFMVYPTDGGGKAVSAMRETRDFGGHWNVVGKADPYAGAFAVSETDARHIFVYGMNPEVNCLCPYILETRDNFLSLANVPFDIDGEQAAQDPSHSTFLMLNSVRFCPGKDDVLLAATSEGMARSDDGGLTWHFTTDEKVDEYTYKGFDGMLFDSGNPQAVYSFRHSVMDDGLYNVELYYSDDCGESWHKVYKSPGYASPIIDMLQSGRKLLFVSNDGVFMLDLTDANVLSPTSVNTINTQMPRLHDAVYDVQGRKVGTVKRNSIYIHNGKKIIMN